MSADSLKQPELLEPKSTVDVSQEELRRVLRDKFKDGQIYLSDNTDYKLCNAEDIKTFLKQDKTNKLPYVVEKYDCDDFAYRLLGQFSIPKWSELAFGMIWTDYHALNCFVGEDRALYFVEPQTDKIMTELEPWMGALRFIIL